MKITSYCRICFDFVFLSVFLLSLFVNVYANLYRFDHEHRVINVLVNGKRRDADVRSLQT